MTCPKIDPSYVPYAVPSWYSGMMRAAMGQRALASRLYASPMRTMGTYGFCRGFISQVS